MQHFGRGTSQRNEPGDKTGPREGVIGARPVVDGRRIFISFFRVTHRLRPRLFCLLIALFAARLAFAADSGIDYLDPKVLTGTIYSDATLKQELFTFRRVATNSGPTIHVLREFNLPDGKLAAREEVVYENGQLKSFRLEELQTGAVGTANVQSDADGAKMVFNYTEGSTKKTGSEKFRNEILVSDMVGPYIAAHWDALEKGTTVKCRLVSISRAETVGFKFFKETDATWHGKAVMMVTLQPSSFIIARLVAPLHFVIEKGGRHRVLQYTGRTTPSIQKDGKWQDLDAVTVFDWN